MRGIESLGGSAEVEPVPENGVPQPPGKGVIQ